MRKQSSRAKPYLLPLLVATGVLLSTLDSSMVNVALPQMMRSLNVGVSEIKMAVVVYLAVITITLVFWGRIGDGFGKGRVYLTGMAVFGVGGMACALSGSYPALLICRGVQALGAAMMMANGPAIIRQTVAKEHLGKTLGFVGIATSCGLMSGPLVSGMILSAFSWRGIFLVGPPVTFLAIIAGVHILRPTLGRQNGVKHRKFDWRGSFLWIVAVLLFILLVEGAIPTIVGNTIIILLLAVTVALFWKIEKQADSPILPPSLISRRYYWASVTTATVSFASLFIILILMPFYLDYILNYSAERIGLVMMALPVSLIVLSPTSGWLYDRLGSARVISTLGLSICVLAVLSMMLLSGEQTMVDVGWRMILLGAGQSIFLAPNSASVLGKVADTSAGVTAGILATARNFGMLTGTALTGTIFDISYQRLTGTSGIFDYGSVQDEQFLMAFRFSLSLALVFLMGGCLVSWFRGR